MPLSAADLECKQADLRAIAVRDNQLMKLCHSGHAVAARLTLARWTLASSDSPRRRSALPPSAATILAR
jgi:hypothetical protein